MELESGEDLNFEIQNRNWISTPELELKTKFQNSNLELNFKIQIWSWIFKSSPELDFKSGKNFEIQLWS